MWFFDDISFLPKICTTGFSTTTPSKISFVEKQLDRSIEKECTISIYTNFTSPVNNSNRLKWTYHKASVTQAGNWHFWVVSSSERRKEARKFYAKYISKNKKYADSTLNHQSLLTSSYWMKWVMNRNGVNSIAYTSSNMYNRQNYATLNCVIQFHRYGYHRRSIPSTSNDFCYGESVLPM